MADTYFKGLPATRASITTFIASPHFTSLSEQDRNDALTRALELGADEDALHRGTPGHVNDWQQFATTTRDNARPALPRRVWEGAQSTGSAFSGALTGLWHLGVAAAHDAVPTVSRDGDIHLPFATSLSQTGLQFRKWQDSTQSLLNGINGWQEDFDIEFRRFKALVQDNRVPLDDPDKFKAFLSHWESQLGRERLRYYDFQRNGKPWDPKYLDYSGLYNPQNTALLLTAIKTADPQAWDLLHASLIRSPERAAIDAQQQQSLRDSPVASYLATHYGPEYAQALTQLGDPIFLLSLAMPFARGFASAGEVTAASAARRFALGQLEGLGYGLLSTLAENPGATFADLVNASEQMLMGNLAIGALGHAGGQGWRRLAKGSDQAKAGTPLEPDSANAKPASTPTPESGAPVPSPPFENHQRPSYIQLENSHDNITLQNYEHAGATPDVRRPEIALGLYERSHLRGGNEAGSSEPGAEPKRTSVVAPHGQSRSNQKGAGATEGGREAPIQGIADIIPKLQAKPLLEQLDDLREEWKHNHKGAEPPNGGEHDVYHDTKNQVAIKLTRPGAFGAKGSLAGYLKQSELSNTTFDDHIRIEGFVRLPGEHADRLVITQPWVHGPHPTPKQLSDYMLSKGFQKVFDGAWLGKDDMYVTDVLERNAIVDGSGQVHLIDVLFSFPSGKRLERLENILNARAHGEDL